VKTIVSYNVNGIRSAESKGFFDWLQEAGPDIICLQETKAQPDQLSDGFLKPAGYHTYWYSAEKKGYSGVALFSKEEPRHVEYGMGIEAYDSEGRILRADFDGYSVISAYFPSGSSGDERQAVKDQFLIDFLPYVQELRKTHPNLIISGDYNIAHTDIDIHNPVSNKKSSGFLPHERAWMTDYIESGMVDSFRLLNPEVQEYSWWSFRFNSRANNKGWRIDYQMVTAPLADKCRHASILGEVVHSDHCPILLELDV
jgi:exodeoxyribonuclease III